MPAAQRAVAGLCRRCYGNFARSRRHFAGNREAVLDRDGRRCQTCGGGEWAGRQ
jgi:5-methylcytosine-specific restriction endonuclease McrA